MARKFLDVLFTPGVLSAQEHYYGRNQAVPPASGHDRLGEDEVAFIATRDSFYLSSVSQNGWPYMQHRGGPAGFLRVLSPGELCFADVKGNRQLISTGNLAANDRVCLFLMDYPRRLRLKVLGYAEVFDAREHPGLLSAVAPEGTTRETERIVRIKVVSFDWNCPKYITPRFTMPEIEELVRPLQERISELEVQLQRAK